MIKWRTVASEVMLFAVESNAVSIMSGDRALLRGVNQVAPDHALVDYEAMGNPVAGSPPLRLATFRDARSAREARTVVDQAVGEAWP